MHMINDKGEAVYFNPIRKLQNRNKPTAKKETKVEPSLFDF